MNGYMGLFLETGDPAFYMMAKQTDGSAGAASGGAAHSAAYSAAGAASGGAAGGVVSRSGKPAW